MRCPADISVRWAGITAPSSVDPDAEQQQSERGPLLRNWRPPANAGLPPSLASPIFGGFTDALTSTGNPSQQDVDAAVELCRAASPYYKFEVSAAFG